VNFDKGIVKAQMGKADSINSNVIVGHKSTIATHRCRAVAGFRENIHDFYVIDSRNTRCPVSRSFGANLSQWTKICNRD
jgi:hypothetical protein